MNETPLSNAPIPDRDDSLVGEGRLNLPKGVLKGNREVITDYYVSSDISSASEFAYKVLIRLNAKKVTFRNVSFQHCVLDGCYINKCVFDSCDFTGARFLGCNFHQSSFSGCKFSYATFERCQIDDDILEGEAPLEENLRVKFARSLRMNYQQLGDAKAVNKAISLELSATATYLHKSWASKNNYFRKKYPGFKRLGQVFKWLDFWILNFIWGNGESIFKLIRSIAIIVMLITLYDAGLHGSPRGLESYLNSLISAPAIYLGVSSPTTYPLLILSVIAAARFISIALLTALLIKRFGRR